MPALNISFGLLWPAGALPSKAAENLHILRNMLRTQTLQYKFPYAPGNGFEFQTDIPCIVLCNGGKSGKSIFLPDVWVVQSLPPRMLQTNARVLCQNDVQVRLNVEGGRVYDAYKPSNDVVLPPTSKLESFRKLVGGAMIGTSKVTPDVAQVYSEPICSTILTTHPFVGNSTSKTTL